MIKLRYIGSDPATDWLPGVPAGDHAVGTEAEAAQLTESGLYERAGGAKKKAEPDTENKGAGA